MNWQKCYKFFREDTAVFIWGTSLRWINLFSSWCFCPSCVVVNCNISANRLSCFFSCQVGIVVKLNREHYCHKSFKSLSNQLIDPSIHTQVLPCENHTHRHARARIVLSFVLVCVSKSCCWSNGKKNFFKPGCWFEWAIVEENSIVF